MKKILSMTLAVILCLGLIPSALAYSTPDFNDMPQGHWAYESVMKMADKGVIKGVGEGRFAPEDKLTAEMFIVLVGRVVFPEVEAAGADWSGPYVAEAKEKGLLTGTNVTDSSLKGEISRYDMAVILAKCVELLKVSASKADSSKVADYGEVPAKYIDAVLMAYGSGLIRGDQTGSFNGANSMTRQEAATVMDRLLGLKAPSSQGGTTEPEKPTESEKPVESQAPDMVHISLAVHARHPVPYSQAVGLGYDLINDSAAFKLLYTEDGGKTSAVIAEGYSQSFSPETSWGDQTIEFDVDRNVVKAGAGEFYLSGEMDYEGVHYATHDLRTDGKTAVIPLDMNRVLKGFTTQYADMVPAATGYQRVVTLDHHYAINGSVYSGRRMEAQCIYYSNPEDALSVKLWSQTPLGGTLLASAPLDDDGDYFMEFGVDILDYNPDLACYAVYIVDADDGTYLGDGNLRTLKQLRSVGRNSKIE